MTPEQRKDQQAFLKLCRTDPVYFAERVLGVTAWHRQAEVMRAVAGHPRVAVRSGHKIGKSTLAVVIALWWVLTRPRSRVVLTSSTDRQVRAILWRELARVLETARLPVGGRLALDPATGFTLADGSQIIGFATDRTENMAGFSGPDMLFIVDEASGVPEPIFEAIEGNRAGGAWLLLLGNPTRTSGTFFDAFHEKRGLWKTFAISSETTPNVTGDGPAIPGLATAEWIREKRAEWGEESPLYAVRVRGDFAAQAEDAVIPLGLVEAARQREVTSDAPLELGVDPARFGDDEFVVAARRGPQLYPLRVWRQLDGTDGAGRVLEVVRELRRPGEKPRVKVDVIGVGTSVYDALRRSGEIEAVAVNVAESATAAESDGPGYSRLRDQLWFGLRSWLSEGASLPADEKLAGELVAPRYGFDERGRRKVESKDALKKRLNRSPDRADAVALAVYRPPEMLPSYEGIPNIWLPFTVPASGF